jgi:hypothetical protein
MVQLRKATHPLTLNPWLLHRGGRGGGGAVTWNWTLNENLCITIRQYDTEKKYKITLFNKVTCIALQLFPSFQLSPSKTAAQGRPFNYREWTLSHDDSSLLMSYSHRHLYIKTHKTIYLSLFTVKLKLDSLTRGKVNSKWRFAFLATMTIKINHLLEFGAVQSGRPTQKFPREASSFRILHGSACQNDNV